MIINFYAIWIFTTKRHKNFTYSLSKQNWSSVENEQVPGVILGKVSSIISEQAIWELFLE